MNSMKDAASGVLGVLGFLALFAYMIFIWITGLVGIEHYLGIWGVIGAIILSGFLKIHIHLLVGAFFGMIDVYEWHWFVALVLVVPTVFPVVGVMVFGALMGLYDKFRSHPQFRPSQPQQSTEKISTPSVDENHKKALPVEKNNSAIKIMIASLFAVPILVCVFAVTMSINKNPKIEVSSINSRPNQSVQFSSEGVKKPNFKYGYTLYSHVSLYNKPIENNHNVYTAVEILNVLPIDLDWHHPIFYRSILRDTHNQPHEVFVKKDQMHIGDYSDAKSIAYNNQCRESVIPLHNNEFLNNIYEEFQDTPHQVVVDAGNYSVLVKVIEKDKGVVQTFYVNRGQNAQSNLPDGQYQIAFLLGDEYSSECKTFVQIKGAMIDPKYEVFKASMFSANVLRYTLNKVLLPGEIGFEPNTISPQIFNQQPIAVAEEMKDDNHWITRQSQRVDDIEGDEIDPEDVENISEDETPIKFED